MSTATFDKRTAWLITPSADGFFVTISDNAAGSQPGNAPANIVSTPDLTLNSGDTGTCRVSFDAATTAVAYATLSVTSQSTAQPNVNYASPIKLNFINAAGAVASTLNAKVADVFTIPVGTKYIDYVVTTITSLVASRLDLVLTNVSGGLAQVSTQSHAVFTIQAQTALAYGVNVHPIWSASSNYGSIASYDAYLDVCQARNFDRVRFDVWIAGLDTARADAFCQKAASRGLAISAMFYLPSNVNTVTNLTTLYNNGYNAAKVACERMRDYLVEVELGNELANGIAGWRTGASFWKASNYDTTISTRLIYQMRGMADAVKWVNQTYGKNIQISVDCTDYQGGTLEIFNNGVTGSNGGVGNTMNSYHWYPSQGASLLTYNTSDNGQMNIFNWLDGFSKPYHLGEFNASGGSMGSLSSPVVSAANQLKQYQVVKAAMAEYDTAKAAHPLFVAIIVYQLMDQPEQSNLAEQYGFGLMTDINTPKTILYVFSMYAKGVLTSAERTEIINTGVWTDTEITAILNR